MKLPTNYMGMDTNGHHFTVAYVEDAPLNDNTPATGLSKALVPMLDAILSADFRLTVLQTHEFHGPAAFAACWDRQGLWRGSATDHKLARLTAKLPLWLGLRAARLHGWQAGLRLRRRLQSLTRRPLKVWATVGVDPLSLVRARALADALGATLELYCVDDIERHPANQRNPELVTAIVHVTLQRSQRVFAITPGLCQVLSRRHGVAVHTLPLIAAASPAAAHELAAEPVAEGFFGFYLGSVNHLYVPGLQALIDVTRRLRAASGIDLRLRLSSRRQHAETLLGTLPEWVVCGPIKASEDLARTMQRATFCYLPYSFEDTAREMTETSFPSKLLDYLPHARAILVYSPPYTVPARLFLQHGLPFVATDAAQLEALLSAWVNGAPNLQADYHRVMADCFSARSARVTLGLEVA